MTSMKRAGATLAGIVFCAGGVLSGASLTEIAHVSFGFDLSHKPLPHWSNGTFIVRDAGGTSAPVIGVLDQHSNQLSAVTLQIPGADTIWLSDVARSLNGQLVACGTTFSRDGQGAEFLGLISLDGRDQTIIRIPEYTTRRAVVSSDGTIWVMGVSYPSDPAPTVIRHFDATGKLIGAFIPQKDIPNFTRSRLASANNLLTAGKDFVAWVNSDLNLYAEISLTGQSTVITGVTGLDPRAHINGSAATDDGRVFVSTRTYGSGTGIYVLNKASRAWVPVASAPSGAIIYGSDGNKLVGIARDFSTVSWWNVLN